MRQAALANPPRVLRVDENSKPSNAAQDSSEPSRTAQELQSQGVTFGSQNPPANVAMSSEPAALLVPKSVEVLSPSRVLLDKAADPDAMTTENPFEVATQVRETVPEEDFQKPTEMLVKR